MVKRIKILIGILLFGGLLFYPLLRHFKEGGGIQSGKTVLTFSHKELGTGVREAFESLAREYEAMHPGVKIEQLDVPPQVYQTWFKTQLIGETAPDVMQLTGGISDQQRGEYFVPINNVLEEPNPYNAGTALENMSWLDTFIDRIGGRTAFSPTFNEYYGVPMALETFRLYYNAELYREIAGDRPFPTEYEAFLEVCRKLVEYGRAQEVRLYPIAAYRKSFGILPDIMEDLFMSYTQEIEMEYLDDVRSNYRELGLGYLEREWSYDDPELQEGLHSLRALSRLMQPAFLSQTRDDALFYFAQERAMIITASSKDYQYLTTQLGFDVDAAVFPQPETSAGNRSESTGFNDFNFGIYRGGKNHDLALDFIHFLTSQASQQKFVRATSSLPSVKGVDPVDGMEIFMPVFKDRLPVEGFPPSMSLGFPRTTGKMDATLHHLFQPEGSVDKFLQHFRNGLDRVVARDIDLAGYEPYRSDSMKQDGVIAGMWFTRQHDASRTAESARLDGLVETYIIRQTNRVWWKKRLRELDYWKD